MTGICRDVYKQCYDHSYLLEFQTFLEGLSSLFRSKNEIRHLLRLCLVSQLYPKGGVATQIARFSAIPEDEQQKELVEVIHIAFGNETNEEVHSIENIAEDFASYVLRRDKMYAPKAYICGTLLRDAISGKKKRSTKQAAANIIKKIFARCLLAGWNNGSSSVSFDASIHEDRIAFFLGYLWIRYSFTENKDPSLDLPSLSSPPSSIPGLWIIKVQMPILKMDVAFGIEHQMWKNWTIQELRRALKNQMLCARVTLVPELNDNRLTICLSHLHCAVNSVLGRKAVKEIGYESEAYAVSRYRIGIYPQRDSEKSVLIAECSERSEECYPAITDEYSYTEVISLKASCHPSLSGSKKDGRKLQLTDNAPEWRYEHFCPNSVMGVFEGNRYSLYSRKKVASSSPPTLSGLCKRSLPRRCYSLENTLISVPDFKKERPIRWVLTPTAEVKTIKLVVRSEFWVTYWPNRLSLRFYHTRKIVIDQVFSVDL